MNYCASFRFQAVIIIKLFMNVSKSSRSVLEKIIIHKIKTPNKFNIKKIKKYKLRIKLTKN